MLFRQTIVFAILLISVANSQSWKIFTAHDNKFKFDNLSIVQNDTLVGIKSGETIKVPVQNILLVRYRNIDVGMGIKGVLVGYLAGALLGGIMTSNNNYETGGTFGAVFGAILGYLLFSKTLSMGTEHNFYNMTLEEKVDKINTLIEIYEKE